MATATASHGTASTNEWETWSQQYRGKILASIILPIGWLCFTLIYVGFWASGFTLFQSVIVILVSVLVLGGVMGSIWTYWAPYRSLPTP